MSGGYYCAYRGCTSKTGEEFSLFRFPKDCESARIWIEACNRQDILPKILKVHKNYRLCELHFDDKYISKSSVKKTLLLNAVPTKFSHLTGKREEVEENPVEEPSKKVIILSDTVTPASQQSSVKPLDILSGTTGDCKIMKLKYSCRFPNCKNGYYMHKDPTYKNKHFYKFPTRTRTHLLSKWKEVCNMKPDAACNSVYVCEDHFLPKDFINESKHRINYSVIPKDVARLESDITNVSFDHPYVKPPNQCELDESNATGNNVADDREPRTTTDDINVELIDEEAVIYNLDDEIFCDLYAQFEQPNTAETGKKSENDFNLLIFDKCEFLLYPFQPKDTAVNENGESTNEEQGNTNCFVPQFDMNEVHKDITGKLSRLQELVGAETEYMNILFRLWKNGMFKVIHEDLNRLSGVFVSSKINYAKKGSAIKDWSVQETTIGLLLYKYGRRFYKYLRTYFHLPSMSCLNTLVSNVSFGAGLDSSVSSTLQLVAAKTDHLDKQCCLVFDKMSLEQGFFYESNRQIIYGYQDIGHLGRSNMVAKYALVFMICGLRNPWKHLVAYYFVEHTMAIDCYKKLIVEVISQIQSIGFDVVSTVCDCNSMNLSVLEQLCKETSEGMSPFYFLVNSKTILTMFNVSDLLERTRNTLFRYDVIVQESSVAKFDHIATLFNMDKNRKFRTLPDLDDGSFTSKDVNVKIAAEQLSMTVAAGIETLVTTNLLPAEAINTAEFVSTIDKLFSSLSCPKSSGKIQNGRKFIDRSSNVDLWTELLARLDNWKVVEPNTGRDKTNANNFIKGWQITLRSVMFLWEDLKKIGVDHLNLKILSERPLKDLFSCINKYDGRKKNLTCFKFAEALKKCVIESCLLSSENVFSDRDALCGLVYLWIENAATRNKGSSKHNPYLTEDMLSYNIDAKFIIDVLFNKIDFDEECHACKNALFSLNYIEHDTNNSASGDTYMVNKSIIQYLGVISDKLYKCLERHCHMDWLEDRFKYAFNRESDIRFCGVHSLEISILDEVVPLLVHKYVQENNRTLQMIYQKHKKIL